MIADDYSNLDPDTATPEQLAAMKFADYSSSTTQEFLRLNSRFDDVVKKPIPEYELKFAVTHDTTIKDLRQKWYNSHQFD
jgi:hypothetical protein